MRKGYQALGVILAIAGWMIGPPSGRSQELGSRTHGGYRGAAQGE